MGVAIANSRLYDRHEGRDRLAALGSMAAGLAHEVKNPLGAIRGAAQLLEEVAGGAKDPDPTMAEFLGIIPEETGRLNRVVGARLRLAPHAGKPGAARHQRRREAHAPDPGSQKIDDVDIRLDLTEKIPRRHRSGRS